MLYIATDADDVDMQELSDAMQYLSSLPGNDGYFTETFCKQSRFIQPKNGMRIDAIRDAIEHDYQDSILYPILLTSLIEAADRVDSTTGVQMAYLKKWSKRSYNDIELRIPELIAGKGYSISGDIFDVLDKMSHQDLIYLDPPYNQHRYYTNYHIWETLVKWDHPEFYGVACKRIDARDESTKSIFNSKKTAPDAIKKMIASAHNCCNCLVLSYSDESWISADDMIQYFDAAGFESVVLLSFDYQRYIGARIGIYSPEGQKVGKINHTQDHEYMFVGGTTDTVNRIADKMKDAVVKMA